MCTNEEIRTCINVIAKNSKRIYTIKGTAGKMKTGYDDWKFG